MAVSSCAKKGSNRVILEVILLFWRLTRTVELVNGEEERRRGPESEVLLGGGRGGGVVQGFYLL